MDYNIDLDNITVLREKGIDLLFQFGPILLKSLILLLVGRYAIRLLMKLFGKTLEKYEIDPSLATFFKSFLNALLWVLLLISVATTLGMEMTSFVAILGAAGLAVGLALQGSLSNFAGGVLILVFKPFRVGDTIEAQGTIGEVESIDILYTKIKNFDNKVVTIPNGALANNSMINYSQKPTRRVEIKVGVAYGTDLKKTRNIILEVLKLDQRIHADPEPLVKFVNFGDSSLDLIVRVWVDSENLWPVYWDNIEAIKEAFEQQEIEIPFPQRTVHHLYSEGK
ncbi:small conductance mechanosensitive channel [Aquiflexum balticum DSM 16537]|uniref:Small conductance mechanosensitive channel n=1 Tax=Aquiflexum balticum DSM 16537 TaxID=758820 RepID=A0A1W2GZN3_9BACT|nr:mechanosensitive ion channel domain-containing protein [Aquiflexum balticum]SMD42113.1 small conductance mechanosensitive channel [Aquiflexum balticum DSM 16537]